MESNFDFTRGNTDPKKIAAELKAGNDIIARIPEPDLGPLLDALKGLKIEFEPTEAANDELILNTIGGAALGVGAALLIKHLGKLDAPTGWLAAAGGLLGAGTSYFGTRYRLHVEKEGEADSDATPIFAVSIRQPKHLRPV